MPDTLTDADIAKQESAETLTDADIQQHEGQTAETRGILKQYWDKINPVTAAQGIAQAVQHPIDTAKAYAANTAAMRDKAADAFQKGNYGEGVRHALGYFLNGIPGLGSALDEAGDKAQSGDYKGAIADTAALATQIALWKAGPAVLKTLSEPGLAGDVAAASKGAAQGAWRGATGVHKRMGVPFPDVATGAAAGGLAASEVGLPHQLGAVIGGAAPIIKGAYSGSKAALAARIADKLKAATALKEALQQEEVPPVPEIDAAHQQLLDGIAQGTFKAKNFASLDPKGKATVETIAQQLEKQPAPEPAPQPPAPAPQPPAPAPQPPAQPASPAVTTIPFSKPDVPPEVFKQKARGIKAINLAKWLSDAGITSEDAARMTDDHWAMASKGAGVNKPSSMSQQEALFRLRQIEALKQSSPQMVDRLQKTGALPAALELQRLMSPVTPPTLPTQ